MELTNFKKDRKHRKPAIDMSTMVYGKLPPQAKDLEEAVLGAIMLDRSAFDVVAEILKAECFYLDAHQRIYRAFQSLAQKSLPIDILTVVEELKISEDLDIVGGAYYVTKLTNAVVSTANIEPHSRIILQKFINRELIRISGEIMADAYDETNDTFDLLDDADRKLTELTTGTLKSTYTSLSSAIAISITRMDELKALNRSITGIPCNLLEIDNLTHGWQNTDLIILAARPSVGKTAFALNIARNAALNSLQPVTVGFFSLEMNTTQLVNRMLSAESGVWLEKINTGQLNDFDRRELFEKGVRIMEGASIFIDDTPALSLFDLRTKARNLKRKENVGLIIIDYLQLMSGESGKGNREQEISAISRGLKGLAKELEVPIIALSQLSRATEQRTGEKKMPQLSDLRESGAIEQDADVVMFMYRPEYYDIQNTDMGESTLGETHIKFAKHRNGTLATIKLRAQLSIQKFFNWDGLQDIKREINQKSWIPVSSTFNNKDENGEFIF